MPVVFYVKRVLGRLILFTDALASYGSKAYLFFSSFSTYTFLMTALAYQLFILDITYITRKVRFIEDCQAANKLKKHDKYWKYVVYGLIVTTILVFCVDYIVEQSEG